MMNRPVGKNDAAIKRAYAKAMRKEREDAMRMAGISDGNPRTTAGRVQPAIEPTKDDDQC